MRKIPLLRYTVVSHPAFTFNTQAEWLAQQNNMKEYTPNVIVVSNTATTASGLTLLVQGKVLQPQTEIEFRCHDAGGVWNINEFLIEYPTSTDVPIQMMMASHTDFYYEEVPIRE